jgi:hypothetical protein
MKRFPNIGPLLAVKIEPILQLILNQYKKEKNTNIGYILDSILDQYYCQYWRNFKMKRLPNIGLILANIIWPIL